MSPPAEVSVFVLAEVVPDKLGGLPAHPLLVHVPVVLIPLAAIGALIALVVPRWRTWLLPLVALGATAALVGVQIAMWSGENLEEAGEGGSLVEQHSHLAEQTRPLAVIFFVLAVAAAVADRRGRTSTATTAEAGDGAPAADRSASRLRSATVVLCAASVVFGAFSTVWVVRTGHTGARSVWSEEGGDDGGSGASRDGGRRAPDRDQDDDRGGPVDADGD